MIIAGTGHRPGKLYGYDQNTFNKLIDLAEAVIEHFNPNKIISGMALGWDLALAKASLNLKIPLIAAIPYPNQPDQWNKKDKDFYNSILKQADHIEIISSYFGYKFLQQRNEWMVDHSDQLIALYKNGEIGGTFNCIEYAKWKNKPIYNVWDIFIEL